MGFISSLDKPVSDFASPFVSVDAETTVVGAARAMKGSGTTEVVVVLRGSPVGIVTERDILYKVISEGKNPSTVRVDEIMSSPIVTVESKLIVREAIAMMARLGVRRLAVTDAGKIVGIVTQKSIVSGRLAEQVRLPELSAPGKLSCPYCGQTMDDSKLLSAHIDKIHIGQGLLQGDTRKW